MITSDRGFRSATEFKTYSWSSFLLNFSFLIGWSSLSLLSASNHRCLEVHCSATFGSAKSLCSHWHVVVMAADLFATAYPAEGGRMDAARTAPSCLVQSAHKFGCCCGCVAGEDERLPEDDD